MHKRLHLPHGSAAPQRGAALFTVLLFCALLASLAGTILRSSMSGARAAAVFADVMRADDLGRSVADAVAYEVLNGGPDSKRGGAFAVKSADADMEVDYVSESARIDANMAPVALISALLNAAGAEPSVVATATARIAALRSAAQPAATAPPAILALGAAAPAAPVSQQAPAGTVPRIQQTVEVASAWGLPAPLARRILPALTVASRSAKVDPTLADRLVLAALMGGDETRVDDYVERRSHGFATPDSALALIPVEARGFAGFTDASAVRAVARVRLARGFERRYEVVVDPPTLPGQSSNVLSWQPLYR